MARRSALEVVEGAYAAALLTYCHRSGVLAHLKDYQAPGTLASALRADPELIAVVFDFLWRTTALLERRPGPRYRLLPIYRSYTALGYHLDKFLAAYSTTLSHLDDIMQSPQRGARLVNGRVLATAFRLADSGAPRAFVRILRKARARTLLELGCGTAPMSRALAKADPSVVAWAVDVNRAMCSAARARVREDGLAGRVRVRQSNIAGLRRAFAASVRARIDTLYAQSLMNAFCSDRRAPALALLRRLRHLFPGRRLFIADYFGRLATPMATRRVEIHTLLQDLVQALSGQGIPPAHHAGWVTLYAQAGCRLETAYEGADDGINWFVHGLRL